MRDNISPEERLFRVIQGEKKSSGAGVFKRKGGQRPAKAASVVAPISLQGINPTAVNKILALILALLVLLAVHYTMNKGQSVTDITDAVSGIKLQAVKRRSIEAFKPLYFYTDAVKKRDIFRPVGEEVEGARVEALKSNLQELTEDLSLVGIYIGRHPEVMIEVKTEEKTYFLRQGDEIKGIKIKKILKDRIILEYQGEEMEFI